MGWCEWWADVQAAYTFAYESVAMGLHVHQGNRYAPAAIPFSSLLTDAQQEWARAAVAQWQGELARLAPSPPAT
jgi:hypothetical protein